jgi:putative DNA primase/helicase
MLDVKELARRLGGDVSGSQVLAPGPGHSRKDRSLSVRLSPFAADGFIVFSHAGDDFRTCRDHVRTLLGLSNGRGGRRPTEARRPAAERQLGDDEHKARDFTSAAAYVEEMGPIRRTPGELYFREIRRIDTDAIADVLERVDAIGWHPRVYFNQPGHPLHRRHLGCIVAVMTDPISARPTGAISRTFIDENVRKVCKAKTLGSPAGIIRLTPDERVTNDLWLAEGLETALSAMAKGFCPIWSTGSTALMSSFPVLDRIGGLTVIADHDVTGAGEEAARKAELRWRRAGRKARIFMPAQPGDLNDLLQSAEG